MAPVFLCPGCDPKVTHKTSCPSYVYKCAACETQIRSGPRGAFVIAEGDQVFHDACFKCSRCSRNLTECEEYFYREGAYFCEYDFLAVYDLTRSDKKCPPPATPLRHFDMMAPAFPTNYQARMFAVADAKARRLEAKEQENQDGNISGGFWALLRHWF